MRLLRRVDDYYTNDLLDAIDRNPASVEARELLIDQWVRAGQMDLARSTAAELLHLDPFNSKAQEVLNGKKIPFRRLTKRATSSSSAQPSSSTKPSRKVHVPKKIDRQALEQQLTNDYNSLISKSKSLLTDYELVKGLQSHSNGADKSPEEPKTMIADLKSLSEGRVSSIVTGRTPPSVRALARAIQEDESSAVETAVNDATYTIRWRRAQSDISDDELREVLAKRVRALAAALPESLEHIAHEALMHAEHEELDRDYVNSDTMVGFEPVATIPRAKFWASEDGYAWASNIPHAAVTDSQSNGV